MKVGILGSGQVAQSLANGFLALGHEVMLSSRGSRSPAATKWVQDAGAKAGAGTFEQAAAFGELVVLATLGTATPRAIEMAGPQHFDGKLVLDVTNPLEFESGKPLALAGAVGSSAGEIHQRLLPKAQIVKAFNTVGNAHFYKPDFPGGPPDMFLCGDDEKAKQWVARICQDFGWNPIDVGGIGLSHYLEATAMLWIITAVTGGHWNQAFKLLRK